MKCALLFCWFLSGSIMLVVPPHAAFGVKISYQSTGSITSYIAYIDNGRMHTHLKQISETEFIKIASGHWPSIYNPTQKNYFEEHKFNCGVLKDSFTLKEYTYCTPMDSLWKLHFEKHPVNNINGSGWSNKQFNPSLSQELYLYNTYGVAHMDADYFCDTSLWKLLKDVQNPQWIENYKAMK
jgi:hypothetical protein